MTSLEVSERRARALPGRWMTWVLSLAVGLVSAVLGSAWLWSNEQARLAVAREQALHLAQSHAQVLQRNVERMLSANHALASMVWQGSGTVVNFDVAARQLLVADPRFLALSISPGGVVRHVVPLLGNEKLLGFDALNDPAQGGDARFARDTGRLTVAGPMPLTQGGIGVVSRLPVFLPDASGTPSFWGFTNVAYRLGDLLHGVALSDLENRGYHYELWRLDADTGTRRVIAASQAKEPLVEPVRQSLEVSDNAWNLDMAPVGGWSSRERLLLGMALVAMVSLLTAIQAICAGTAALPGSGLASAIARTWPVRDLDNAPSKSSRTVFPRPAPTA